jgi:hypothetical protein
MLQSKPSLAQKKCVHKIEFDSRKIEVNDVLSLFVVRSDGHYIQKSNRSSSIIVCDIPKFEEGITGFR